MSENPIFLNQVLHGYRDGHTLLASSINLPPEAKRVMLPISDMSGGRILRGFEEYITGYPIKQIHCYALAKTWYAPEMNRPGCVWTQTLLIDFDDVPRINNIDSLVSSFERPSVREPDFTKYSEKKHFFNDKIGKFRSPPSLNFSLNIQELVLYNLYEYPDLSILLETSEGSLYEDLFLKVWQQQWPRLKRNFSFCTGAISPRTFLGKPLDLQATPSQYFDSSFSSDYKLINSESQNEIIIDKDWVYLASESLKEDNDELRTFYKLFGSDVQGDRSAFKALTKAFILLTKQKPQLEECIEQMAQLFNEPLSAYSLKNFLFGPNKKKIEGNLPNYDERTILYCMSITTFYNSFDYKKLDYEQRFVHMFHSFRKQDVELLKQIIKIGPNLFGEESLIALANELSYKDQLDQLWNDKQLSLIIILLNPRLAYNKRFWVVNSSHHGEIVYKLLQSSKNIFEWDIIIAILIELKSNIDVDDINLPSLLIVNSILNAANSNNSNSLPENWLRYLKLHEIDILTWINNVDFIEDKTIEILVSILNPNSIDVCKNGPEKWINYLKQFDRSDLNNVHLDVHAFCIALALNSNNPLSNELYRSSLEIIYYALAKDFLSHNAWRRIEVHTKPLGLFKDWDRCKKLVNAIVDHFIANNWNIYKLIDIISNSEIRERLTNRYKKKK